MAESILILLSGREGGEPMSTGSTVGKVKQGVMFLW